MKVVVPRELAAGETRVAATPRTVKRMDRAGLSVHVESGAGVGSGITDTEFRESGAEIVEDRAALFSGAEVVLGVNPPDAETVERIPAGAVLVATLNPMIEKDLVLRLANQGVSAFSLDMVPRIARAQSMDVLSSMSTLSGYQAVLLASMAMPGIMPYLTTAAGTLHPAKVLVLGAGVAGLQAIATARRLGALVWGYDIRPVVKEQVESLGAEFLELIDTTTDAEDAGGYAREQSEDQAARQQQAMTAHLAEMDAVITTALIPGRPAPTLLTSEMVSAMKPGSVIVDLAAERGGNCELTRPGQNFTSDHGVSILGPLDIPRSVPAHASLMYANNVANFLLHVCRDGQIDVESDDEVAVGTLVTSGGRVVHQRILDVLEIPGD
ncbi:MAG TPA: Re/Si-specific NAD(P)(+) transhydrogenase subunit alpha [Planctomycetaceae bacterium]|nr:Re/Si-specific NAD(P)(+) transhydrogenase subunit alpha [Planctomycetaceae bacterium]HCK54067.1 Re/Si-specific NAD(P)(+) transhydrogenase subunit alpha [Planctomycetaceae bacterium]|tara:strand:- start:2100 stop:3245 length:1146 start_codon:yes stop_codon:yes gene_type:complete